jgi:hypothetical protein
MVSAGRKRDCRVRLHASPHPGISDGAEGTLFIHLFTSVNPLIVSWSPSYPVTLWKLAIQRNGTAHVAQEQYSAAGRRCVCLGGHTGMEALGGGSFEEMVRPPPGNCSLNTQYERKYLFICP